VILSDKSLEKCHNVPFASVPQSIQTSHIIIKTFSLLILSQVNWRIQKLLEHLEILSLLCFNDKDENEDLVLPFTRYCDIV
jgi:hypothetical protein